MFNSNCAQDELKQINYSRGWIAEKKPEVLDFDGFCEGGIQIASKFLFFSFLNCSPPVGIISLLDCHPRIKFNIFHH